MSCKSYRSIFDFSVTFSFVFGLLLLSPAGLAAAPPNRITGSVDAGRVSVLPGHIHRLAQPQFDQGVADPSTPMNYMVLMTKPSASQQAELEGLLTDQQNPSSPNFRKWLTPEEFGKRFGLSVSDQSKIAAWLTSQGFTIDHRARSQNWIAFSGTAGQVSSGLHTSIHRFQVNGEKHFANIGDPAVPEALSDVVGGFLGLNDFHLKPYVELVPPDYNVGTSHYLVPADWATIYDVAPLYQAGITGSGQSIAVVGESDVLLSDIRSFRSRYGLPVNDPQMVPYNGTDPGYNGAEVEGDLDLEWSGAIAPNATIYYVYGPDAIAAMVAAVERNLAPIITVSYGGCEVDFSPSYYRSVAQQANAQGITILAASGDAGAAGCDFQDSEPQATRGLSVSFPASLPEVTAMGGTQFVEGSGSYWGPTNSSTFGSALSYIPEKVWNQSTTAGLGASGGGASQFNPKPAWQTGPGVPSDSARDVPDVALSASGHDAYYIYYGGKNTAVAGTSCAAPSMAGLVALLNQYQVSNGIQKTPGLGNINPQLYRLAQSVPAAFHDITSGDNQVHCAQGTPNCATGSLGYPAGPGYDEATGLGSVDANVLATQWNTSTNGVIVTLSASPAKGTVNDTVQLTATVVPASGTGTPTGTVSFAFDEIPLGVVPLANGSASLAFPLYQLQGTGTANVAAEYSGDAAFSAGGATKNIPVTTPTGAAAIVPSAPNTVWPQPPDAQGLSWQTTLTLSELAGVAAIVTGFTIDGQAQTLSQYFPSPNIPPRGTLNANVVFRNLAAPVTRTFGFTGTDAGGTNWSRQIAVNYFPLPSYDYFGLTLTPLIAAQNTAADPGCQWAVQLNADDLGGYGVNLLSNLYVGGLDFSSQIPSIFGTTRLDAWQDVQGTLCFSGITPPASNEIEMVLDDGNIQEVTVSFVGPVASPAKLSATPAGIAISAASASQPAQTTLAIDLSDKTQPWTASIYPPNPTTAWLSASALSGTGPAQIVLTASGTGFEPGAYKANIVIQCANAVPQYINVPVMFVLGASSPGTTVGGVANAASFKTLVSPGMLLSVFGTKLSNTTGSASGNPLPFPYAGVSATVNGLAAPVYYASPNQLNIQVPYEAGAGPAVLGVNNNGQIAGFEFQMSPSSPGIFADANGNLVPSSAVSQGGITTLYVTGTGDVSPALKTAYSPSSTTAPPNLPMPLLPLSVTVGGVPAFVEYAAISAGLIGTTQINILVPSSVPLGTQPVVVTVGGVASAPVNIVVQPPPGGSH
jgi:uncharacterized protein (TIGR03437 family)